MLSRTAAALAREVGLERYIPYRAHVAPGVLKTCDGDYLQVFRLGGQSFESADAEQVNGWHERLNVLWRNLAEPGVALWTHVVRRRAPLAPLADEPHFAGRLLGRYLQRLSAEQLMVNELYVAVLYRPAPGRAQRMLSLIHI